MAEYTTPTEQEQEDLVTRLNRAVSRARELRELVRTARTEKLRAEYIQQARAWEHKAAALERRRAKSFEKEWSKE